MSPFRLKGTAGPLLNRAFPLRETLRIGGPGCDIVVEASPGAEGVLAEVRFDGDRRVTVHARSPDADLAVNGEPVEEAELAGGDELRIGACRLLLQAPGLRPERVLTEEAVRRRASPWPWILAAALLAAAAGGAWHLGAWERLSAWLGMGG
jgi:hypothetical protein